jgi:glycyl-tRNA synthetase beta chain
LELPKEVIITPMKVHQKYFPVYSGKKELLPYFITVSNCNAKDMDVVAKGNERVLRARLNDAKFFYEEDKKYKLDHFVERLRKVVFQKDIGTSYEKMERFRELAVFLSDTLNPEVKEIVNRAAYLCKGDLETNMVYEFPELQGIMGKYYALYSGEKKSVADAIFEHYLPRFSGDMLPGSDAGAFISIADRIDTIVGFFGIGKIPTGTADPYALRRHAIAIINIIIEKKYRFSLLELIERASLLYENKIEVTRETIEKIMEFFAQRFLNIYNDKFSYNSIDSVISIKFDDIFETFLRLKAVEEIRKDKNFQDIVIPFKRVANITKNWEKGVINKELLVAKEEKELYEDYLKVSDEFNKYKNKEDFVNALKTFTKLKDPINNFFDNVLVMDKNEEIKNNRLNLLKDIFSTFNSIVDLTKI